MGDGPWPAFVATAGLCGLLMVFAGLLVRSLARRAAAGELEVNWAAGIGTRATMASDEAWVAGHQAAEKDLLRAGAMAIGSAVVSFAIPGALGLLGAIDAGTALVVWTMLLLAGVVVLLALLLRVIRAANAAAEAVTAGAGDTSS